MSIRFTLNGRPVEVTDFDPNTTLLAHLRATGLTGSKEGCAEGECGACAVLLTRRDREGRTFYEPVNGCLMLLGACADQEILSVEGVAQGGALHPVQAAMVERGGSQCGYCTPGFVVSLFAEYYRRERTEPDPEAIAGNLCRCTGYRPIRDVLHTLGRPARNDPFEQRLTSSPPSLGSVLHTGADCSFFRPTSLEQALSHLAEHPEVTVVAGGTDVVVEVNQRHRRSKQYLSLDGVLELRSFDWAEDHVRIGAALSLTEIEHRLSGRVPILDQLFPLFSSRLIRNRATLGGNLMTASPIGDSPPALLALDAEVELVRLGGTRRIPLADFFTGYRKTAANPGEILSAVRIPLPLPAVQRFYKVSKRQIDDISSVAAGFSLSFDTAGKISAARLAYGGVAAVPARAVDAEAALLGQTWELRLVKSVEPILARAFKPIGDHRGSADYRAKMVVRLLEKLWFDTEGSR
ncbi:MAG: FAD binding domain-containing protein [Myxococcales bacterium]|nr:FAD binding domain-containing protein [Myxococcales bacterium]